MKLIDHAKQMYELLPVTDYEDMRGLGGIDYTHSDRGYYVTLPDGPLQLAITIGDDGMVKEGRIYDRDENMPPIKVSKDKLEPFAGYILGICLDSKIDLGD